MATGLPTFKIKAQITAVNGVAPTGADSCQMWGAQHNFFGSGENITPKQTVTGTDLTEWIVFDADTITAANEHYGTDFANSRTGLWQSMVAALVVSPAGAPASATNLIEIAGSILVDESAVTTPFTATLFGTNLGLMVYRIMPDGDFPPDATTDADPQVKTLAQFHERYWDAALAVAPAAFARPSTISIADYVDAGDSDFLNWALCFGIVERLGANTVVSTGWTAALHDALLTTDIRKIGYAVYHPPGYFFPYHPGFGDVPDVPNAAGIAAWVDRVRSSIVAAGFAADDLARFNIADEPGAYHPQELLAVATGVDPMRDAPTWAVTLADFRDFIQAGDPTLAPADVGESSWDDVYPVGVSMVDGTLAERTLYYWSMRFFPWYSSTGLFAPVVSAILERFPDAFVSCNENNFSGRSHWVSSYNPVEGSLDNSALAHDWHIQGAATGFTASEDYNNDAYAWKDSRAAALLSSAARRHPNGRFGTYLAEQTGGLIPGMWLRKALSYVGVGSRSLENYRFGPAHITGDGFAEKLRTSNDLAAGKVAVSQVLAHNEAALVAGTRPLSQVAVVAPRSAQMFDNFPTVAGQNDMSFTTAGHAEALLVLTLLKHANIQAEYLDEDDLTDAEALAGYKVIFLTTPNLPPGGGSALATWAAGTGRWLVTFPAAGSADYRNEPDATIHGLGGLVETGAGRLYLDNIFILPSSWSVTGALGTAINKIHGADSTWRTVITDMGAGGTAIATFVDNDNPAIVLTPVGSGFRYHFAFWPTVSYFAEGLAANSQTSLPDPDAWPTILRTWVTGPVTQAGVVPPVELDVPFVEGLLLEGPHKAAVTLLNWNPDAVTVSGTVHLAGGRRTVTFGPIELADAEVLTINASSAAMLMVA